MNRCLIVRYAASFGVIFSRSRCSRNIREHRVMTTDRDAQTIKKQSPYEDTAREMSMQTLKFFVVFLDFRDSSWSVIMQRICNRASRNIAAHSAHGKQCIAMFDILDRHSIAKRHEMLCDRGLRVNLNNIVVDLRSLYRMIYTIKKKKYI